MTGFLNLVGVGHHPHVSHDASSFVSRVLLSLLRRVDAGRRVLGPTTGYSIFHFQLLVFTVCFTSFLFCQLCLSGFFSAPITTFYPEQQLGTLLELKHDDDGDVEHVVDEEHQRLHYADTPSRYSTKGVMTEIP